MFKIQVSLLLVFFVSFSMQSQDDDAKLLIDDAKEFINDGYYESGLSQLQYYFQLTNAPSSPKTEALFVDAWLGLENYMQAENHVEEYLKIASPDDESYNKIKAISTEIESEVMLLKAQLKEWASTATKNGEPYDWDAHSGLYPVGFAPKFKWCGYVNKEGLPVTQFIYKVASHFENGIAYVDNLITGDKELINPEGTAVVTLSNKIQTVYPFQDGYAAVRLKALDMDKQPAYGIINEKGERVDKRIGQGFSQLYIFSDGSRYPILRDGKFGAVSVATGESIIDEEVYAVLSTYHDGKILVRPKNYLAYQFSSQFPSDFGMLDHNGEEFIALDSYPALDPFFNEYSIAAKAGKGYGVLNKKLEVVIPFKYSLIGRGITQDEFILFDEGDMRGKAQVYNVRLNKMLDKPVQTTSKRAAFPEMTITYPSFSEKYMALITKKGKVRFYDHDLNDVFEKDFVFANDFSEGMAAVMDRESRLGYIDETGEMIVDYKYQVGKLFTQDLAAVATGAAGSEKYGYINKSGVEVIPLEFDYAEPFFDATSIFKFYYSPKQLMHIGAGDFAATALDITFDMNEVFFHLLEGKKIALVKKKNKLQFIDQKGKVWVERLWDDLEIRKE